MSNEYADIINWFNILRNTKIVKSDNPGKTGDQLHYCINLIDFDSDEIDKVFEKLKDIANIQKNNYKKNSLKPKD